MPRRCDCEMCRNIPPDVDALVESLSEQYDQALMLGATPFLFMVCEEDLRAAETWRHGPVGTFRGVPVKGLGPRESVVCEQVMVIRQEAEAEVRARIAEHNLPIELAVLERGKSWAFAETGPDVPRSD